MALVAPTDVIDHVRFDDAIRRMDWRQGEHVTMIGPTGRGKTELEIRLIDAHPWVVFLGTKRIDVTQDKLRRMGYRVIGDAAELNPEIARRFIFRPGFPKGSAVEIKRHHQRAFADLLMRAFRQTGWTVAADELRYLTDNLGLRDEILLLYLQGRSQGNTVIAGAQRPRFVPLEAFDQATHLFFWRDRDRANADRVAEIVGLDRRYLSSLLEPLNKHDVLYVNTITDEIFVTNTRW